MWTKPYGRTGKNVSAIGFGGMRFPKPEDIDASAELVLHAHRRGINYFDTAPGYCSDKSEDIMAAAIKHMPRDSFYISTKTFAAKTEDMRAAIEKSLKRLGVDQIDFYHMWCLNKEGDYQSRRDEGAVKAMLQAKEEGLIGHVVASSHLSGPLLKDVLAEGVFEGVLLGYCAANFSYRQEAVDAAGAMGLGVAAMNPLGGGLLAQHAKTFDFIRGPADRSVVEAALRFVVSDPSISTALVGFSSVEQIDQAVAAVENFRPYEAAAMERLRGEILGKFDGFCTGCGYCLPCPNDVPIPQFMETRDVMRLQNDPDQSVPRLRWHWVVDPESGTKCSDCGACEDRCTQHLPIRERLKEVLEAASAWEKKQKG
ncbi:MAG: aldo/keto reductase [Planctomycetaceae bacterium]|nr:aldo/keto reductase [Planctomycetaceae bacterium]